MPKLTTKELQHMMDLTRNIRNVAVIGEVDQGKSTLTRMLVRSSMIWAPPASDDKVKPRDAKLSSGYIPLYHASSNEGADNYLINIVETPGHDDYSYEVTNALRVTDGALLVVDCTKQCFRKSALSPALSERVLPVLTLNKMDRFFLNLNLDGERAYRSLQRTIESLNAVIALNEISLQLDPSKGNVAFSSGLHGWAFTLSTFARIYATRFGVDETKMRDRLWGENYFDSATRKWTEYKTESMTCKRGFVQFCYEPIKRVIDVCMAGQKDELASMIQKLGLQNIHSDYMLTSRALMQRVMQAWLPANTPLLEMMVSHLPSPVDAQRYRLENLYEGSPDDIYGKAIKECNPNGPLVLYVSKMIPTRNGGPFYALGRVFSGKITSDMKVRIVGPNYVPGEKRDIYVRAVQQPLVSVCNYDLLPVEYVSCGNIVVMAGLEQFISHTATLTNEIARGQEGPVCSLRSMRFSVSSNVRLNIGNNPPEVVEALKFLSKSDPMFVYSTEESGQHVISGTGCIHLERKLRDLEEVCPDRIIGPPFVSLRETVLRRSNIIVMYASPNGLNQLYMEARPMEEGLMGAIVEGRIGPNNDPNARAKILWEEFGWNPDLAQKVWCFGPNSKGLNMLVDATKTEVPYLNDVKDSIVMGFQWGSKEGMLADEEMQGICFEIQNAVIHPDASERCASEMIVMTRCAMRAAQMEAKPRLVEPVYIIEFDVGVHLLREVYRRLNKSRGRIFRETWIARTQLYNLKGFLPVLVF